MAEARKRSKPAGSRSSAAKKPAETPKAEQPEKKRVRLPKFMHAIGGYFKGSWQELHQTKWPTRRATWSLTLAVIVFTTLIMLFIIALDYLFDLLFQRLIL